MADETDEDSDDYTKNQLDMFLRVVSAVESKLNKPFLIKHCANTGATARFPDTYLDMVRPGLLLYGYGQFASAMGLTPAMTVKTTVSTIKIYPPGTRISYGGTAVTDKLTRVAVLPYGYADGFLRCLSNKCSLYTKSGPARLLGRICMDMCMIDVTDMPEVDVDSEVEIFGTHNSIEELADAAGTIPYELTCAVSKRVPRIYMRDGTVVDRELLLRL